MGFTPPSLIHQILTSVIVCLRMEILWAMHSLNETNPDRVSVREYMCMCVHVCMNDVSSAGINASDPL